MTIAFDDGRYLGHSDPVTIAFDDGRYLGDSDPVTIAFDDSALGRQLWAFNGPSLGLHEAGPSLGLHRVFTGPSSALGLHWAFTGPSALGLHWAFISSGPSVGLQLWAFSSGPLGGTGSLHWAFTGTNCISSTFRRHFVDTAQFVDIPPRCRRIAFHRHFVGFRVNGSRVYAGHLTEKTGMGI